MRWLGVHGMCDPTGGYRRNHSGADATRGNDTDNEQEQWWEK